MVFCFLYVSSHVYCIEQWDSSRVYLVVFYSKIILF